LTFRYLDGREVYSVPGRKQVESRWREKRDMNPTFYQVPYRSIVPQGSRNVLCAGRMVDADCGAFGAVRVMVNCNQMGEAAAVACHLALEAGGGARTSTLDDFGERRLTVGPSLSDPSPDFDDRPGGTAGAIILRLLLVIRRLGE
jgi:hypothetical protein